MINYYLQLIQIRSRSTVSLPSVHCFNTFLYPKLKDKGFNTVKRWTRKVNIFEHDLIIFPIIPDPISAFTWNNHWVYKAIGCVHYVIFNMWSHSCITNSYDNLKNYSHLSNISQNHITGMGNKIKSIKNSDLLFRFYVTTWNPVGIWAVGSPQNLKKIPRSWTLVPL